MTCINIGNKFCDENAHNIIEKMVQGRNRESYIGGLFDDPINYPILEGNECIQYLQEHLPFHLPQIEHVLSVIMRESGDLLNDPVNIMDLGSGPATVPLAFSRTSIIRYHQRRYSRNLRITTVEPSTGFNAMINIFKATNTNRSVEIINTLKYKLFEDKFMSDKSVFEMGYDWIIIANSISAIGKGRSNQDLNKILNEFITNVLCYSHNRDNVLLTIIEGKGSLGKYFDIPSYLSEIEKIGFDDLKIIKTVSPINLQLSVPYIKDCKFYKTKYPDHYKPYVNSKSLLLELR